MLRTTLIATVITAALAASSPASGWEFCLDQNKTLYKLVNGASKAVESAHGPPSHSLKEVLVGSAAEAVVKGLADSNFHVPTCPSNLQRALRAMVKELEDADRDGK